MHELVPLEWSCDPCRRTFSSRLSLEKHLRSLSHRQRPEIKRLLLRTHLSLSEISSRLNVGEKSVKRIARVEIPNEKAEKLRQKRWEDNIVDVLGELDILRLRAECRERDFDFAFVEDKDSRGFIVKGLALINGWFCRVPSLCKYTPISPDEPDLDFILVPLKDDWLVIPCDSLRESPVSTMMKRDMSLFLNSWGMLQMPKPEMSIFIDIPEEAQK